MIPQRFVCGVAIIVLAFAQRHVRGIDFESLSYPGATYTELTGIDGSDIVGFYSTAGGVQHGFLFNGAAWTSLDVPFPQNPPDPFPLAHTTRPMGISGNRVVGEYYPGPHGFAFEGGFGGGIWTPLDYPGNSGSSISDVDGLDIVGVGGAGGFHYDGTTWTPLSFPGSFFTAPLGVDDDRIVGYYLAEDFTSPPSGFLYEGNSWTSLDYPGSTQTQIHAVDGNRIVGNWWDATQGHGFIYDGMTWQTIDYPDSINTVIADISGNRIVGTYADAHGISHNFVAIIPEPSGIFSVFLSLPIVIGCSRRYGLRNYFPLNYVDRR